jgi:hypothetical protein
MDQVRHGSRLLLARLTGARGRFRDLDEPRGDRPKQANQNDGQNKNDQEPQSDPTRTFRPL